MKYILLLFSFYFFLPLSGPLIMVIIGDKKRNVAATISDTVNTASRIENLTKHFGTGIMLRGVSLEKIKNEVPINEFNKYHFRFLGKVQVKGKTELVEIHECLDGHPPEILKKKIHCSQLFEEGMKQYFKKNQY